MKCSKNNPNGIVQKGKVGKLRYLYTGFYIIQCRGPGGGMGDYQTPSKGVSEFRIFSTLKGTAKLGNDGRFQFFIICVLWRRGPKRRLALFNVLHSFLN